jgi:Domain of unknown function (DUF4878)
MHSMRLARGLAILLAIAATGTILAAQDQKTASQFYMDYRAAFDKAKTVDELLPFMSAESRKQVEATPAADRAKMFELMKTMGKVTNLKIVKETKSGDGATLNAEGLDPDKKRTTGTISIIKEGGAWKLGSESWKS